VVTSALAPSAAAPGARPAIADHGPRSAPPSSPAPTLALAAVALVVVGGVVLRFWTGSTLWFDEAQSVAVARLPVGDLLEALAHDGHPPVYYLLLHGWMAAFGESDAAVRALSGILAVAALPLAWALGRQLAGPRAALAALVVMASSPFAVRYATEARMYSLVMVLVLTGALLLRPAVARGGAVRLGGLALVSGLLVLTHYWGFYLVLATAAVLGFMAWWAGPRRRGRLAAVGALAGGQLLFLPWLPTFLEQAATTGTPWGIPWRPAELATTSLIDFGGGPFGEAHLLGAVTAGLVGLALVGRAIDGRRIELDLLTRPEVRAEVAVIVLTLGLATVGSFATASATATRYLSVVFPLHAVLAGVGVAVFASGRLRAVVLAAVVGLSAVGVAYNVDLNRTQGDEIAAAIDAQGHDADVVAFCPDQLGPATMRHLDGRYDAVTFPDLASPERVDWQDYAERVRRADPAAFAEALVERSDGRTIWLAWAGGHRAHRRQCETVAAALAARRPAHEVVTDDGQYEHGWLFRYET
jgi:mannosyltransferase